MKFQCKIEKRTTVYINGRVLKLDDQGVVNVEDPADIAILRMIPTEWSLSIQPRATGSVMLAPVAQMRGAHEFMDRYQQDDDFRNKVDNFKSVSVKQNYVESQGFKFSPAELEKELTARAAIKEAEERAIRALEDLKDLGVEEEEEELQEHAPVAVPTESLLPPVIPEPAQATPITDPATPAAKAKAPAPRGTGKGHRRG